MFTQPAQKVILSYDATAAASVCEILAIGCAIRVLAQPRTPNYRVKMRGFMETKQSDRIANALEEMVFIGAFEDGQRLDESGLAKQFGVSRTPVREALQRLVSNELAKQLPRRGVFVRRPSAETLFDMYETMAEIEAVCGRLTALRLAGESLDQLLALNARCEAAAKKEDISAYSHHNEAFHHMVFNLTGNEFLASEAKKLFLRLKPFRRIQFRKRGRMAASVAEHADLISAFSARKPERAVDILRSHVATQGTRFYRQMEELRNDPSYRIAS